MNKADFDTQVRCLHNPNSHPNSRQTPSPSPAQTDPSYNVLIGNIHHDLHNPTRLLLALLDNEPGHCTGLGRSRMFRRGNRCLFTWDQTTFPQHQLAGIDEPQELQKPLLQQRIQWIWIQGVWQDEDLCYVALPQKWWL